MRGLIAFAVVLFAVWLIALVAFKVTAATIHLLLVAAVIAVIAGFLRGRTAGVHRRSTG